jgi:hypothetical protein
MKHDESILPVGMVGIMVPEELLDEAVPGIPTEISFTKQGIEVRRGWRGERKKIIECLKRAIARLEREGVPNVSV